MFVCVLLCMCSTFLCKMYCKHILSSPCQWSARPRWWCWRPSSTASQTPPAGPLCRATCAHTEVLLKSKHRISVQIAQQLHPLPLNPGLETFPSFVIRARISHCQIWKSRRCQIWIAFHVFRFNWLAAENAASKARNFSSAPFRQNRLYRTFFPPRLKQFWTSNTFFSWSIL